jgi:signal peptidase I
MQPTFKPGQMLYVRPALHNIAVGDVIVFQDKNKTTNVVHRVIRVDQQKYFTRGDNNAYDDPDPLHPKEVLGVVRWVNKDGMMTPVQGGMKGQRRFKRQKRCKQISRMLIRLFSPIYQFIKSSGIVAKFWHPEIKKIHLKTEHGVTIKYTTRNGTVAQWTPNLGRFTYQHPYDLIIKPPEENG